MKRFGSVIKVKEEKLEEYKKLHKKIWPEIEKLIYECNIRNYSIFLKDNYLFGYYEYVGRNYKEDMERMAKNPKNKEWWEVTGPCQEPLLTRLDGEWWAEMEEVFHQD